MGICQIIYLVLTFMSLGITLALNDTPKTGKHNFGVSLVSASLQLSLLYFGGFFK